MVDRSPTSSRECGSPDSSSCFVPQEMRVWHFPVTSMGFMSTVEPHLRDRCGSQRWDLHPSYIYGISCGYTNSQKQIQLTWEEKFTRPTMFQIRISSICTKVSCPAPVLYFIKSRNLYFSFIIKMALEPLLPSIVANCSFW